MSDPVSILSFYFVLVGFIGSFLINNLANWFGTVLSHQTSVKRSLTHHNTNREAFINLEITNESLKSGLPWQGFVGLGVFITLLTGLSFFLPINLNQYFFFLYLPLLIAIVGYWLGGSFLLYNGYDRLKESSRSILPKITGL